jgi:predicted Zn-dependent protease
MALLIAAMVAALAFGQATDDRSSKAKPATEQPEFFDKPEFVVSGVTDFTYRGGHGSDSALRATEALTEATASLSSKAATHSMSLSEAAAREKSLRARVAQEPANAELHHQLAEIEERLGKALEAVQQYQRAAELNASETNIFDWGTELLKHRAAEPAIEVFARGYRLFPESIRIQLGLAVAYDLHGDYEHAA